MPTGIIDLSAIPAIDAHCHPFPESSRTITPALLRDTISVSLRGTTSPLNETMILSRVAISELAALLECDATYDAVVAARNAAAEPDYPTFVQRLFTAQRIAGLLIDPGYPDEPLIEGPAFASSMPVPVWEGYRIERYFPVAGSFHSSHGEPPRHAFGDVVEAFRAELDARARRPGFTFFKSIMAYRTGLAIQPVTEAQAATAWDAHRAYGDAAEKTIRDYLFRVTCAKAREHDVPFQIHTGHTSHVIPWPEVNPILLAPVLGEPAIAATNIVLVHSGYPYCTEAGYLTSVFPNVACDLSLMIPWAGTGIPRRVEQVLEAAPTAKVMYGSDAIHLPEMNWLGALVGRRGLTKALAGLLEDHLLTPSEAEATGAAILHGNAERIYGLAHRPPVPVEDPCLQAEPMATVASERMNS